MIHILRHPLDIVFSVYSNHLTHGFYCAYDLMSIARHYVLPDLNASFSQMVDCAGVSAKFKSARRHALGGRGVFGRVWVGRAAGGEPGARAAAGRAERV